MGGNDVHGMMRLVIRYVLVLAISLATTVSVDAAVGMEPIHVDVAKLGAKGDGSTINTEVFQRAIDSCFANGAGTVFVPAGEYLLGTIVLKTGVTLELAEGSRLKASRDIEDYLLPLENATRPVLIYANGANFIRIIGKGTIDGQAQHTYEALREVDSFIEEETQLAKDAGVEMKRYYIQKPDIGLVWLTDCENVHLEDVTLQNSSFWTLHIMKCKQVELSGIRVFASLEKGVNADGIDINSSVDVFIHDCEVRTGDDAIVLKTWFPDHPSHNIQIENCTVSSSSTALKIGTESHADISDVRFKDCIVENSNRGLSIVVRDGANISNVEFVGIQVECTRRHFNWWGDGDPIWLYLDQRNAKRPKGSIQNVKFKDIQAIGMGTSKIESNIEGISEVKFENVTLTIQPENTPDHRANHIMSIENASGIYLENMTFNWDGYQEGWGSNLNLLNVSNLRGDQLTLNTFSKKQSEPLVSLNSSKDIEVQGMIASKKLKSFLSVRGKDSRDIMFIGVEGVSGSNAVQLGKEVINKESIKVVAK